MRDQKGFTQIDILLALVIVALLVAVSMKSIGVTADRIAERNRVMTAEVVMAALERWWDTRRTIPALADLTNARLIPPNLNLAGIGLNVAVPPGQPQQCLWSYVIATVTITDQAFTGAIGNRPGITYDAATKTYTISKPLYRKVYTDYFVKALDDACPIAWNAF